MLHFCGRTCVVQERVNRIIDDRTGRMIMIRGDAIILEGIVCSGERSVGRWFCPRQIYPTGASPGSFAPRVRPRPTSGAYIRTEMDDVAVIIVSTNEAHWLEPACPPSRAPGRRRLDVVVVDNESRTARASWWRALPEARVVACPNHGFPHGTTAR